MERVSPLGYWRRDREAKLQARYKLMLPKSEFWRAKRVLQCPAGVSLWWPMAHTEMDFKRLVAREVVLQYNPHNQRMPR